MIRVPAVLVGLVYACVAGAAAFWAAYVLGDKRVLVVVLPLSAWVAGFLSGNWSDKPAPIPGLAIGLFVLAVRAGLGLGMHSDILFYVEPVVALLEMIAAISGGMAGTLVARRVLQPVAKAKWSAS